MGQLERELKVVHTLVCYVLYLKTHQMSFKCSPPGS